MLSSTNTWVKELYKNVRSNTMRFLVTADTDIGISKQTNQDSILVKHADTKYGEIILAAICDGMGGLSKGELASAMVVRAFSDWFDRELPHELFQIDMHVIAGKWELMLKELNGRLLEYGRQSGSSMGTTFTGILLFGTEYAAIHVGDTRLYHISDEVVQLTDDQTVTAKAVRNGEMTTEQAKKDKNRNTLLQCIGASKTVKPQIITGTVQEGIYMICSDGFRHELTNGEIYEAFRPEKMTTKENMHESAEYLINLVKKRNEKDNISVVLIKV